MGVGLYLAADPSIGNPLDAIEHTLRTRHGEVLEGLTRGDGILHARLHPAAEDVEFALDGGRLTVSAKTSTAGPGYHAYLCELLHALAVEIGSDFRVIRDDDEATGDETTYFETADRARLEDEMRTWLRGIANVAAEQVAENASGLMISMSTDTVFEFDEAIATPLGPRWVQAVVQDPRSGIDIFPWWSPGLGAEHAAGRALVRMWTEVRWRAPVADDELELLESIDGDLRRAHELDPTLALPWAEWALIQGWLDRDDALSLRIDERARGLTASIGYRRRPLRVSLTGGWSIRIPGEMATTFDDEGTWCGFVPGRTLWMTSFTVGDPANPTRDAAGTLPSREPSGTPFAMPPLPEGYAQRASLGTTDDGETMLSLEVARPHHLALFTFVLDDQGDLEWVRGIAAGIR